MREKNMKPMVIFMAILIALGFAAVLYFGSFATMR
jgi:hypothetical protein